MRRTVILTTSILIALGGCSPYQPIDRKVPDIPVPARFEGPTPGVLVPEHWWVAFGDEALDATVLEAFAGNLDLRQAWARLDQAMAQATILGAPVYPDVTLDAGATRTRQDNDGSTFYENRFRLGMGLTWELDLWKKIANRADAASLLARASRDDAEQTALLLSGTVVDLWFTIQEQERLMVVLTEQIASSRDQLELIEARYGLGIGSALQVLQQRLQLAEVESEVPTVEATLATTRNQLAVVLGRPPQTPDARIPAPELPGLPAFPELPAPRDLLETRPDLRAAYKRLAAADLEVAAAIADLLPTIRISLEGSFNAPSLSSLFEDTIGSLGGSLLQPVFDADRRGAEVDRRKAIVRERAEAFSQQFLVALREIKDSIDRERHQVRLLEDIADQIRIARAYLLEARFRYTNGQNEYLDVIAALQSLQRVQRREVAVRKNLLATRADLYLALGGDWLRTLEPPSIDEDVDPDASKETTRKPRA
jgi:multidrug efflux system outer membrane protein